MRYVVTVCAFALALFVPSCAGVELAVSLDQITRSLSAPVRPKAAAVVFESGNPPVETVISCSRLDSEQLECRVAEAE